MAEKTLLDKMLEVNYRGTNKEVRMKYLVSTHSGMGSMGEAMQPFFTATVDSKEDARELEKLLYASKHYANDMGEMLVITLPVEESLSVADAIDLFNKKHVREDDDED